MIPTQSRRDVSQTGVEFFNSLSRRVEPLTVTSPSLGIYVCGITPYDATHLGHAFTYTTFDVVIRLLRYLGREVRYVQNITDVDDDILRRAGSLGMDWRELGNTEVEKFLRDSDALNNLRPEMMPKASEHIDDMLAIVGVLLERDVAYERHGNVYFDVNKTPTFATRLFGLDHASQLAIANERGNSPDDPNKKGPLDFVLWQKSKPEEPSWTSPWGDGRPGWHIECSALSKRFLGSHFSIHGGGSDLLFPHHECEIAQAEYSSGPIPADHWMHVGMVRYEGEKMSKSLGNMIFVSDLLRTLSGDVIRCLLLSHHYRSSWEYEAQELEHAQDLVNSLRSQLCDRGEPRQEEMQEMDARVTGALAHDLDTPNAMAELQTLAASNDLAARRTARKLATEVLGFRL